MILAVGGCSARSNKNRPWSCGVLCDSDKNFSTSE